MVPSQTTVLPDITATGRPWPMRNPIRRYPWGSQRVLAELQNRNPTGQPEAELWMGGHPGDPSDLRLPDGRLLSLAEAVRAGAPTLLGDDCTGRFGPRLPFLLKVLAVSRALSIQVHPSAGQAVAGFRAEQAARLPAGERTFTDPYPKPEMLVAVSRFFALAGLRPRQEIARLLGRLDVPRLALVLADLSDRGPASALALLATWPQADRAALAETLREHAERRLRRAVLDDERLALTWVLRLAEQHPADPLAVAPCLLRLHRLAPGEAMYLPPGVAHAYLSGTGIEVMGASDNVVRAGLTGKHVDGAALSAILDPGAEPLVPVPQRNAGPTELRWTTPAREFALARIDVCGATTPARLPGDPVGPQILFCLDGQVRVELGSTQVDLPAGHSVFLPATIAPVTLRGRGTVFRAGVGRES